MNATGTPKELSVKLNLSERMVYQYMKILKEEFNAPVKYSKTRASYYYETEGSIKFGFLVKKY